MTAFYIPLTLAEYLLVCIFATVVVAMLFAGVYGIKKAKLLGLRWPGYGEAIGWLTIGIFELFILVEALIRIWPHGLPEDFKGISKETWTSVLLWFAFTMFIASMNYLSFHNLKRREAAERQAFAAMKNASFGLRRELERTIKPNA